ncbi:tyrosine-type recombinase/integrase [Nocardia sp. NBC_01388]|uniref:tyrosine-type recombinase/integrase n=1 Tax=Nocardia sp. NBC_01388 TaxID=2903596 RepID=UPI0032568B38
MGSDRLVAGGRPKKKSLEPVKGSDGMWRLDRVRHRTYSGMYTRTSASARTRKGCAQQWEIKFEKNRHKGSVRTVRSDAVTVRFTADDKMTGVFTHFLATCEKKVKQGLIKQSTVDGYERFIFPSTGNKAAKNSIKMATELGGLTVGEVGDPAFLSDYLEGIHDVAKGTASVHYALLKQIFGMLTLNGPFKYDPMAPVSNPYRSGGGQRALKRAERDALFELFLARMPQNPYCRILFLLLLGTGMRIGEALGLRWADVDLKDGPQCAVIYICGTVVPGPAGGKGYRQDKRKNDGAPYYLTLPMWLTVELREWRAKAGDVDEQRAVLSTKRGTFRSVSGLEGVLRQIVGGTAMDWVHFGNFRDTAATHVKGKTRSGARASAQLGHAEGSTVASTYYIDKEGYEHPAVDNAAAMESLKPSKLERDWNSGAV